jgi:hypothetical protein
MAESGFIFQLQGGLCRMVASFGIPPEYKDFQESNPIVPGRGTLAGRTVLERRAATRAYAERDPPAVTAVELGGVRSVIAVPMLKDNEIIGIISIFRQEVRPFTDKQVGLLTNFAAPAVIAIENARLLNELRQRTDDLSESLEQQTATSEVLRVISSSPGRLEPVFEAMLQNATRICEAKFGTMYLREGDAFRAVTLHNAPPAFAEARKRAPIRPGPKAALTAC